MHIEDAIDQVGLTVVAERMSTSAEIISPQRVNNWRTRGIPDGKVINFCRAVGWQITPHELRPDIYPNPDDGLPEHMRHAA